MASDYATGEADEESPDPDFTSHGLWGLDEHGDLYAVDWWSEQADPDVWIDAAARLVKRHHPRMWFEEKGVIRRAINGALSKTLRERDIFVHREALASAGSKSERALGFAARASVGAVLFPSTPKNWNAAGDGKFWADRVIDQLCGFTGQEGRHDDDVDVCSLVSRGLDRMTNPRPEAKQDKPNIKQFTRAHIEAGERAHQLSAEERKRHYR
jgi:predicted phage terminase large subunit-like protein